MIITRLCGGLGNQLFQYAAAQALAMKQQTEVYFDITNFKQDLLRKYALTPFAFTQHFASEPIIEKMKYISQTWLDKLKRKTKEHSPQWIKEKHFQFDPSFLTLQNNVYLDGYWQSERYFKTEQSTLRNNLQIITPLNQTNHDILKTIKSCQSVSIHIRRTDYISNSTTNSYHGTCEPDYYALAMKYIANTLSHPNCFVFSDDMTWTKQHIHFPFPTTYINHNNPEHGHEDLRLMSHCNAHIIANSSFSWWGAWLNPKPDKIVITPKHWFNKADLNTADLIPDEWIQL